MKKITLVFLLVFVIIVGGIFTVNFFNTWAGFNYSVDNNVNISPTINLVFSEVSAHSSPDDCYLVINSKIYDLSSYIGKHPGGRDNITDNCGSEVTGVFASIHSNFAWDLLSSYYVGDLSQNN
ncbi:hypothetical protein GW933_02730 [Candidatus Falkowbacteria bacterium]|uniref:Cytochrome b5 heme-binding domain-containing protein n=1 Tax=Candidatus Buchananbacteria bacterium CG10_big_fil_rev_8_21_14_0_10_33_19 TaxID=1974525 RepID=A0A2H0W4D9_9BACT|nr:hypothetical protein [Candidatus Falkowbacteria bacterium]PIS06225.1 MAG: hypothetical protein COT80_01485 [Candidatus Buchananbacteria bacterium CG10_big_fil_rev_8_21_14_0_10_33_19]